MSVDGKVRALSKLLRDNFGFVMQGVGVVVPIFATYDGNSKPEARLYFYDAMGAQFEVTDYAATGSGSPAVRGILYYENNWGEKPLQKLGEEKAVTIALRALDTAAGRPIAALGYRDGILFLTVGRARQKIFEIYDRIGMGAIGHPGDIERLRLAAIELASTEGFTRSAADVSLRRLAHYSLSPVMKSAFEQVYGAPFLARLLFAEIGERPGEDLFLRVEYDGEIATSGTSFAQARQDFAVLSGTRQ